MEHNTQRRHYPSFTTNADTFILDQGLARLMKLFACSENIYQWIFGNARECCFNLSFSNKKLVCSLIIPWELLSDR